jgi:transposase
MQTLEAFQQLLALWPARDAAGWRALYHELLGAIAAHRVADRPDWFEPRLKKRRKDYCGWFSKPRAELKRQMAKGMNKK